MTGSQLNQYGNLGQEPKSTTNVQTAYKLATEDSKYGGFKEKNSTGV